MPTFQITMDDGVKEILLGVFHKAYPLQRGNLTDEEMLELAIDALVMSYDSSNPEEPMVEDRELTGQPKIEVEDALKSILSPDISTEFTQPVGAGSAIVGDKLTFDDISRLDSQHPSVLAADTPIKQLAIATVFNALPFEDWRSTKALELITKTEEMLSPKNSG